jgi:hypothetical protein
MRQRYGLLLLAILSLAWLPAFSARLALVVGIDSYQSLPKLRNARADADAISVALRAAGYQVDLQQDRTLKQLQGDLRAFRQRISGGDEVVLYFAGHGVQVAGANYLLPSDVGSDSEDQVRDEALALSRVLDEIRERKPRLSLAIIDACRDNPFSGSGRSIGGRGLAGVSGATGQMVIFAAGEGQKALDRLGDSDRNRNGVFTRIFVREMARPGVSIRDVLFKVRDDVAALAESVRHEQVPAVYDQVRGNFYFVGRPSPETAATAVPPESGSPSSSATQVATARQSPSGPSAPQGLAEALREVLTFAQGVGQPDERTTLLFHSAWALGLAGDLPAARASLKDSLEASRAITDPISRRTRSVWLPIILVDIGDNDAAVAAARAFPDAATRATALGIVASRLARNRSPAAESVFVESLEVAKAIGDDFQKEEALSSISIQLGWNAKDPDRARRAVELMKDQDRGAATVARALARKGDFESAARLARSINSSFWSTVALSDVATQQAKGGQRSAASALLSQLASSAPTHGIKNVAVAQAAIGDIEGALKTLARVSQEYEQADVIIALASAEAERGRRNEAMEYFSKATASARVLERETWRSWRLSAIAIAQAKVKYFDDAYQTVSLIEEEATRRNALQRVALEHGRAGAGDDALARAKRQQDRALRAYALLGAASGMIAATRPIED